MLTRRQFNKLLLSAALLPSFGCSNLNRKQYIPGTLRLNLGYEPDTLDWTKATDSYSFDIISNIMTGLTKYNNQLNSEPSLATSWDISKDGKRYLFYLDKTAKWSDGRAIIADDFVYSWLKILYPLTAAPYAYLLYPIKNAYLFNSGKIEDPNKVGIKALNDHTLKVELESPVAFFINLTSWGVYYPQRKDIAEKYGDDWTEPGKLVSCGPFNLESWKHEYKITLNKNIYYNNPALLEKIKYYMVPEQSSGFSLYLNNELDFIDSRSIPVSEIETVKKMDDTYIFPLLRVTYIGFNVNKAPFDNKYVRAAFSHSIDRNSFPKVLRRGEIPTTSFIPPGLKNFYSPEIGCQFNPELAKKYLALAGYKDGVNFPKVTLLFPTKEDAKLIAETLQSLWKQTLNVNIEIQNIEWKVYLSTLQKDPPHIFRMSWGADFPDPDTFVTVFSSNSGNNHGRWKNSTYDELITLSATTQDLEGRKKMYEKIQKILLEEDVAIAPLFFNTQVTLTKPWVKNMKINSLDVIFCEKMEVI